MIKNPFVIWCGIPDTFEFLNFHICQVQGDVSPSNVIKKFDTKTTLKKVCLKRTSCLKVSSIASEGKVRFGHFFENDSLDEPKKMPSKKSQRWQARP